MIVQLDKVQKQIKKAATDFVKGEFSDDNLVLENRYPELIWKKSSKLGFPGIALPEQVEGEGFGYTEKVIVAEELCRGDASIGACLTNAGYGAEILLQNGTEEQKAKWLPKVAAAEILSALAVSELGSDKIAAIQTTAVEDKGEWVICGDKTFVRNAGSLAGMYMVLCRTDADASAPEQAFSIILVEADRPGIHLTDVGGRLGLRQDAVADIRFDKVRVPLENLIGKKNQGFSHMAEFYPKAGLMAAAQALGIARGAFDRSFGYVQQREQFRKKIIEFQITRHKLADLSTAIEASRLLTYQAAWAVDNAQPQARICAMAKLHATQTALSVTDEAIQLLGGYGYIEESGVARFFREARVLDVLDGARNILKDVIMETISGKG